MEKLYKNCKEKKNSQHFPLAEANPSNRISNLCAIQVLATVIVITKRSIIQSGQTFLVGNINM